jgi:transcriptional regulator with XRE-family HTH domain
MKIGEIIRQIREKEKTLSEKHLAQSLGIKTAAYSNIENNITDISLTRFYEIADILGVSPEYILRYRNELADNGFKNNSPKDEAINKQMKNDLKKIKNLKEQIQESKEKTSRLGQV